MFEEKIRRAAEFIRWLDAIIDGKAITSEKKFLLAGCAFDLVMEYQKAIVTLVDLKIYGPAFAMMRPVREVFVRGVWLANCASNEQVQDIIDGNEFPGTNTLISEVEATATYSGGQLSKVSDDMRKWMHGMTHGGVEQFVYRFSGSVIEPAFSEGDIVELLDFVSAYAALSGIEICSLANDPDAAADIYRHLAMERGITPKW